MTLTDDHLQQVVDTLVKCDGNKTEAAKHLGLSRSTYLGQLDIAEKRDILTNVHSDATNEVLQQVKLKYEDRIKQLEKDLLQSRRNALTTEQIRKRIFGLTSHSPSYPKWVVKDKVVQGAPGIPTLQMSDFHWGERVEPDQINQYNEFNQGVAEQRFERLIKGTINLCHSHMVNPQYPGMVVILGGDMVSGDIHEELSETNEGSMMQEVFLLFDQLAKGLSDLADKFGRLYVPCVIGNHGRLSRFPKNKNAVFSNYDWLLYTMLERHFKVQGDDRLQFEVSEGPDVLYRIYDTTYLATHGDRMGVRGGDGIIGLVGPIARGIKKVKGQYAAIGQPVDWVLIHHFHTRLFLDTPGGIVNNSLKGWDEYAQSMRLEPTKPSQNLWWTHPEHGITFDCQVFLDEPKDHSELEWVSWPRDES